MRMLLQWLISIYVRLSILILLVSQPLVESNHCAPSIPSHPETLKLDLGLWGLSIRRIGGQSGFAPQDQLRTGAAC